MVRADYIKEQVDVKREWKAIKIFFLLMAIFLVFMTLLDRFFEIGVDAMATILFFLMIGILIKFGTYLWRRN
jgi:hypothetical protein